MQPDWSDFVSNCGLPTAKMLNAEVVTRVVMPGSKAR